TYWPGGRVAAQGYLAARGGACTAPGALERQHQELGAGTNRVPEPGAGSGTAANIKGSVTRSRDNYLENRRCYFRSECFIATGWLFWQDWLGVFCFILSRQSAQCLCFLL
ncbi:hypothetical protein, partial [Stutzerimonas frequens]|uniref:hypothetical protein n=1 Tax=Stutzerimonas frequens TaxID=2968969 RepID=UPI001E2998DB